MKRKLLLLLVTFIFQINGYSQYCKGNIYFEATYRYNSDNELSNGLGDKKTKSVLNSNLGYLVLKNFVVGVGFNSDYTKSATTIQGLQMLTMDGVAVYDEHITNSSILSGFAPAVFVKYIYPFTSKFSVSLMLRSSTDRKKEDVTVQSVNIVKGTTNSSISKSETGKYINIGLSPEIRYSITKNIGLQINFNGYIISSFPKGNTMFDYSRFGGYVVKKPITYEKSETIDFSPKNWSIGFFVVI